MPVNPILSSPVADQSSEYRSFLESKLLTVRPSGIDVPREAIHSGLFLHQSDLTWWGLRKGRAGIFAATGLGKTRVFVEIGRLTGQRTLVLSPLGVARQTVTEAAAIGVEAVYARQQADAHPTGLTVTNYDMARHFDPDAFGCVILDEAAILRDFEGKTRTRLIEMFRDTPYRYAATATPSPNDTTELANYAEFLGICSRAEMLATWFVHDDAGWRLKGHAREPFYRWLASWAMSLKRPSDLGHPDDEYNLPELSICPVIVSTDYVPPGQLFATTLKGITDRAHVRKSTVAERVQAAVRLIDAEPDQPWIVWAGLNAEQDTMASALGDRCVSVYGSLDPDEKERRIGQFIAGERNILVTKVAIAGQGLNLQRCARMVFVGLSDSFADYHQAIRRCWRFGQTQPVHAFVVLTDLEETIYANVLRKEREFEAMTGELVKHVSDFQRAELGQREHRDEIVHAQPMRLPTWLEHAS